MKTKKLIVYLDMDGVIVDWVNGMRKFVGKPESFYDEFRADPSTLTEPRLMEKFGGEATFRRLMFERSSDFWLNLTMFPWSDSLIKSLEQSFDELVFFSSPGNNPEAAKAKVQWQLKHYPEIPIFLGKHKHLAASENKVLIDDNDKKVNLFTEEGGLGILWPNQFEMEKLSSVGVSVVINDIVARIEGYEQLIKQDRS